MKANKKVLLVLTAVLLAGAGAARAAQTKPTAQEQLAKAAAEVGTIVSMTDTSLVPSHEVAGKKVETTFVLTPGTVRKGTLAVGAKVVVHYRVENDKKVATKVKVGEPKHTDKTKATVPQKP